MGCMKLQGDYVAPPQSTWTGEQIEACVTKAAVPEVVAAELREAG